MYVRTSLICAFALATCVACGDKGDSDNDDTGGKSSGGNATSAGTSSGAGKDSGGTPSTGGGGSTSGGGGSTSTGDVTKIFSFDSGIEGFKVQDSSGAEGVTPVPKADIMLSHNADEGEPDPGSLQMDIPFDAASQYVSAGVNLDTGVDVSGKTIKANVKVVSGYGSEEDIMTAPANAKLYVKTGETYVYASASVANITAIGSWTEISFEPEFPGYNADEATYDVKDVREIGIQLDTNSASTTASPAVVVIDSIRF